jgi:hypothetical protein
VATLRFLASIFGKDLVEFAASSGFRYQHGPSSEPEYAPGYSPLSDAFLGYVGPLAGVDCSLHVCALAWILGYKIT